MVAIGSPALPTSRAEGTGHPGGDKQENDWDFNPIKREDMMLIVPPTTPSVLQTNLSPSSRLGTTVTSGTPAHTKGAWTNLVDPTNLPSYGLFIRLRNSASAASATNGLLDIAYGPTGGGSEEIVVPDVNTSGSGILGDSPMGKLYFFPVYIPSGVRVSARYQFITAAFTISVAIWLCQDALYPWWSGKIDAYGVDSANSRGTAVAPGNGAWGSWVQITASTNRNHRYWTAGIDMNTNSTQTNADGLLELGTGPDAANVSVIFHTAFHTDTAEIVAGCFPLLSFNPVPSGSKIFARIAKDTTVALGVIAYGMD